MISQTDKAIRQENSTKVLIARTEIAPCSHFEQAWKWVRDCQGPPELVRNNKQEHWCFNTSFRWSDGSWYCRKRDSQSSYQFRRTRPSYKSDRCWVCVGPVKRCLILSKGRREKYIAMSHCWGESSPLVTDTASLIRQLGLQAMRPDRHSKARMDFQERHTSSLSSAFWEAPNALRMQHALSARRPMLFRRNGKSWTGAAGGQNELYLCRLYQCERREILFECRQSQLCQDGLSKVYLKNLFKIGSRGDQINHGVGGALVVVATLANAPEYHESQTLISFSLVSGHEQRPLLSEPRVSIPNHASSQPEHSTEHPEHDLNTQGSYFSSPAACLTPYNSSIVAKVHHKVKINADCFIVQEVRTVS